MSPETYLNTTSMLLNSRRDTIEQETKPKPEDSSANFYLHCLTEMQLRFVAAWTGNLIAAARVAGYSNPRAAAYKLMKDPFVVEALQKKQDSMLQESGELLARTLPLSRADVIDRLWQLAQLSPDRTNCNITGQVKAAQALEQIFAINLDHKQTLKPQLQGRPEADLEFYVVHGFLPYSDKKPGLESPAETPQLSEMNAGSEPPALPPSRETTAAPTSRAITSPPAPDVKPA